MMREMGIASVSDNRRDDAVVNRETIEKYIRDQEKMIVKGLERTRIKVLDKANEEFLNMKETAEKYLYDKLESIKSSSNMNFEGIENSITTELKSCLESEAASSIARETELDNACFSEKGIDFYMSFSSLNHLKLDISKFYHSFKRVASIFIKFVNNKEDGYAIYDLNSTCLEKLENLLSIDPSLVMIVFYNLKLSDVYRTSLIENILKSKRTLLRFILSECILNIEAKLLTPIVETCKLQNFVLERVFHRNDIISMFQCLGNSSNTLTILFLSDCDLRRNECEVLGKFLDNCTKIRQICLSRNLNMQSGIQNICYGLLKSLSLVSIDLTDCNLDNLQFFRISSLILNCLNLEKVYISKNPRIESELLDLRDQLRWLNLESRLSFENV